MKKSPKLGLFYVPCPVTTIAIPNPSYPAPQEISTTMGASVYEREKSHVKTQGVVYKIPLPTS